MVFLLQSVLINGAGLVGYRFTGDGSNVLDITDQNFAIATQSSPNITISNALEFTRYENDNEVFLDDVTRLQFYPTVQVESINPDLNDPKYLGVDALLYRLQMMTPDVTKSKNAAICVNNLLYNTEFFKLFNVKQVFNLWTDYATGAFSIKFGTYYPEEMAEIVLAAMNKYLKDIGTSGVEVFLTEEKEEDDTIAYELKADVNAVWGKATVNGIQMYIQKSKTPAVLPVADMTVVHDNHGITYSVPTKLDIYNRTDVHVDEVDNLIPSPKKKKVTFPRLFLDTDQNRLILLPGSGSLDDMRAHLSCVYASKYEELLEGLPVLKDIRIDDATPLPVIHKIGDNKYNISATVSVDMSKLPYEEAKVLEVLSEAWTDAMYSADFELKKFPMNLHGDVSLDGNNITFSINVER